MLKAFLRLLLLACVVIAIFAAIWEIRILERINGQATLFPTLSVVDLVPSVASSPTLFLPMVITATTTLSPTITPPTMISPTAALSFTEQMTIGYSVAGRPLVMYRLGTGKIGRLIIGGIHGGSETNTIQLTQKLIEHLNTNPDAIPPDVTLFILPVLNVDGYDRASGTKGRANENGVDINRNFNAFWSLDWPRDGCWNYGPISAGSAPDSEPETRALETFLVEHKTIDALISYHSAALGIFAGGQPPDDASINLAETLHSVSAYPYPPIDGGCIYTGQLIDWASLHNIAAVDIELSNHTDLDYEINVKILKTFLAWKK